MDVIPAGLRSEATSRYIADVINTPEIVRVRYAFPNGWGAHVAYAGGVGDPRGPEHSERWLVVPGFAIDRILDAQFGSSLTRGRLPTRELELALLEIRGYRQVIPDIRPYAEDLWTWGHAAHRDCPPEEKAWFFEQLGIRP